jgi:hypothetical protein
MSQKWCKIDNKIATRGMKLVEMCKDAWHFMQIWHITRSPTDFLRGHHEDGESAGELRYASSPNPGAIFTLESPPTPSGPSRDTASMEKEGPAA